MWQVSERVLDKLETLGYCKTPTPGEVKYSMRLIVLVLVVTLGFLGAIVFGYYAFIDWDALQKAYANYLTIVQNQPDLTAVFIAEAQQNIHRINVFADGVWTLLCAILAAIGLLGLCLMPPPARR